jgi:nanoRNase/pAp phosphatase (c-di-AMP/oligoRNAs hydrolase)
VPKSAELLLKFLAEKGKELSPLLILTHDDPDPDSLASAFALKYILETACGGTAKIAYGGVIGRMENRAMVKLLNIPVHKLKRIDLRKYVNVALVDTQPAFENNSFSKNRKPAIVIDQHPSVVKPVADFVLVDTECGATSVILAQALLGLSIEVPQGVATALAYGILSDTMNLYRARQSDILDTYISILGHADLKILAEIQNPAKPRDFFATLAKGVNAAMARRGLMVAHLGEVNNPDLVSLVADFLLTYKRTYWTFCTGRYHGRLHASLRIDNPNPKAKAGEILRDVFIDRGKAGGHGSIAGGSLKVGQNAAEETWKEAETLLTQRLLKRLRLPGKGDFHFPFRQTSASPISWTCS